MDKLGVANLKKVLSFVIELANVIDKMGHDAGVGKYGALLMLVDEAAVLGGVDFAQVLPEIKDLDDAEEGELYVFLKEKFDIADDKLEMVIESGVGILMKGEALVKEALALVANLKG